MVHKETGTWGHSLLGDELDEEFRAAQVRLQLVKERARDDELRLLVTRFQNTGTYATMATSKDEATLRMDKWTETLIGAQERLGLVLRAFV